MSKCRKQILQLLRNEKKNLALFLTAICLQIAVLQVTLSCDFAFIVIVLATRWRYYLVLSTSESYPASLFLIAVLDLKSNFSLVFHSIRGQFFKALLRHFSLGLRQNAKQYSEKCIFWPL